MNVQCMGRMCTAWVEAVCMSVWIGGWNAPPTDPKYGVMHDRGVIFRCMGFSHRVCVMLLSVVVMVIGFEKQGQAQCVSATMCPLNA